MGRPAPPNASHHVALSALSRGAADEGRRKPVLIRPGLSVYQPVCGVSCPSHDFSALGTVSLIRSFLHTRALYQKLCPNICRSIASCGAKKSCSSRKLSLVTAPLSRSRVTVV